MAMQQFLAMTGAEILEKEVLPSKVAWMACHFSPYATGLSNIPRNLPAGSMVIVNDRTPVCGHDPELIAEQLRFMADNICCSGILLDFQRPNVPESAVIAQAILDKMSCPVGITECYAQTLDCPVFLAPIPHHLPPEEYLSPWQGREIWLETALDGTQITVTETGSSYTPLPFPEPAKLSHQDDELHCHYDIAVENDLIRFHLYRKPDDLLPLLTAAEKFGVTRAVGLYQEWKNIGLEGK